MFYLSQLLGTSVEDTQHERLGKIIDVLAPTVRVGAKAYPSAVLVEGEEDQPWRVSSDALEHQEQAFVLRVPLHQFTSYQEAAQDGQEISLAHEVFDKQVIDIVHKKAVRVNDICLDDDWNILGVDSSALGLVRRIAPAWLLGARGQQPPPSLLPWNQIEIIGSQQNELQDIPTLPSNPRAQSGQLADLHPADIAEIVHQLTPGQGARLIEGLDDETAADTMEEIDTERQRHILENIQPERAADILEEMEPDEAADLIAQLPEDRAQELLRLMTPEESEDVQELLEYEENSAGGIMTTDYVVLNQTRTVAEALEMVRSNIQENDVRTVYVYCVQDETQDECNLLGVVSLWDLLIASPTQPLQDLMETDIITVELDADPRDVAEVMAKYNLLAVPVVSSEGILEGIITVDDALDVLLPNERRRKPTRMY